MPIFASDQRRQWDGSEDFFRGTETEKRTEAMEVLCFHHFVPLMFHMPAYFSWLAVPQFQFGSRLQYVSVMQWSWCMKTFILLTKQSSHKMLQLRDISFVTVGLLSNSTLGKQKILFGKNNMFIRQDISKMHFPASSLRIQLVLPEVYLLNIIWCDWIRPGCYNIAKTDGFLTVEALLQIHWFDSLRPHKLVGQMIFFSNLINLWFQKIVLRQSSLDDDSLALPVSNP